METKYMVDYEPCGFFGGGEFEEREKVNDFGKTADYGKYTHDIVEGGSTVTKLRVVWDQGQWGGV